MAFKLPKDIAQQFWISQKTVYNYLSKYREKISTKKEYWKTFVSVKEFENVLQKVYVSIPSELQESSKKERIELVWKDTESKDMEYILSKNKNLEKVNRNLEEQIQKYAIYLSEEKNEKKDILVKYENLQKIHLEKVESFGFERIKYTKRNGRLLTIAWVLVALWIFLVVLMQLGRKIEL